MTKEEVESKAQAAVGATVAAKYKLLRLLGEGGMGAVYEAEHLEIGKKVAIKLVRALRGREDESAARFIREARAASAVDSDHIVQVFDVGQDKELGLYMVMELLAGRDLGALLSRAKRLGAPVACAIADQAASALEKAHAAGVIHRDLKPENVFLRARDDGSAVVKLVDFGVAKVVRDAQTADDSGGITRSGSVVGSPCYMSPEQAQGFADVDHRTDVYSLGAVLYEMLTGKRAFSEKPTYEQTIVPIITQKAPRVSASVKTVSPALDQLVADMMTGKPEERPPSMQEVRKRLAVIQPGVDETRLRIAALEKGPTDDTAKEPGPRTGAAVVTDAATILPDPRARTRNTRVIAVVSLFGGIAIVLIIAFARKPKPAAPEPESTTAAAAPAPSASAVSASTTAAEPEAPRSTAPVVSATGEAPPPPPAETSAASAQASASAPKKSKTKSSRPSTPPTEQVGGVGITTAF